MKTIHPLINLLMEGTLGALFILALLLPVNLAVKIWIRIRRELRDGKSPRKPAEKEEGL